MAQAQLAALYYVQLSNGKLKLIAWVNDGLLQVANHLCTLHISPFFFVAEAEEQCSVIIQLGGRDASLSVMLEGLLFLLNSVGTPPYLASVRSTPLISSRKLR